MAKKLAEQKEKSFMNKLKENNSLDKKIKEFEKETFTKKELKEISLESIMKEQENNLTPEQKELKEKQSFLKNFVSNLTDNPLEFFKGKLTLLNKIDSVKFEQLEMFFNVTNGKILTVEVILNVDGRKIIKKQTFKKQITKNGK